MGGCYDVSQSRLLASRILSCIPVSRINHANSVHLLINNIYWPRKGCLHKGIAALWFKPRILVQKLRVLLYIFWQPQTENQYDNPHSGHSHSRQCLSLSSSKRNSVPLCNSEPFTRFPDWGNQDSSSLFLGENGESSSLILCQLVRISLNRTARAIISRACKLRRSRWLAYGRVWCYLWYLDVLLPWLWFLHLGFARHCIMCRGNTMSYNIVPVLQEGWMMMVVGILTRSIERSQSLTVREWWIGLMHDIPCWVRLTSINVTLYAAIATKSFRLNLFYTNQFLTGGSAALSMN